MSGRMLWLASYPKSGNTWLRAVLSGWMTGAPARLDSLVGGSAFARAPFDRVLGVTSSDLTPDEVAILRPRVDEHIAAESDTTLIRKTHDGFYPGPDGEPPISVQATRAAVYVIRDPRDVAVSLAHHEGRDVDWAAERLCDPETKMGASTESLEYQLPQRIGSWSEHVRSWVADTPFQVHVLRYEDGLSDPVATFGEALRFAGLGPVDDGAVALAVEHASFERLQAEESREGFRERPRGAERFFREGRAGSWREEMTPEAARRIELAHGDLMRRFGYL
jgi:aryl sulfotransferase